MSKIFGIEVGRKAPPLAPAPAWRADFRRREELPDLKVVRTGFLLNYGAVALAVGLAAFAISNEIEYAELRHEISGLEAGSAGAVAGENALLKRSGIWSENARISDAYAGFRRGSGDCARLLAEIGAIKSPGMTVKSVSIDTTAVKAGSKPPVKEIRVTLVGTQKLDDVAKSFAEVTGAYRKFRELKVWSGIPGGKVRAEPVPTRVASNLQSHVIEFTFEIAIEGAGR